MTAKKSGHDRSQAPIKDAVLREVLDSLEQGRSPDREALENLYPGQGALVQRLVAAASSYDSMRLCLRREREDPALLQAGTVLGDFRIEKLLGCGGMGTVYRAQQLSLGLRPVALKVLHRGDVTERAQASFRREALAAAALHHPRLAEVYGFGTSDEWLFYAMRLVEGPTLHEILSSLSASRDHRTDVTRQCLLVSRIADVCSALAAVHAAGLVHRDVKPGNIMLEGGERENLRGLNRPAVLVDFGLIRPQEREADACTKTTSATPAYAAPEVLLGKEVDARADVFSVGATLHDLLAARLPADRLQASAGMEPLEQLVPGIDPDLAAVVAQAVDPDAEWRYLDAGAFLADLQAWLASEPVSARSRGIVEGAVLFVRDHPAAVLKGFTRSVAVVLALALVVVLSLAFSYRYSLSQAAANAYREGDIYTLGTLLDELNGRAFGTLLLDRSLADLAAEFARSDDGTVETIYRSIRNKDVRGALLIAAKGLQADKSSVPLLNDFLSGALKESGAERPYAVYLVARIFLECPDTTPEACRASTPFRSGLARIWKDPNATERDRLWALAALGGCGTPELVPEIIEWASSHDALSEERRLGLAAAGLILHRGGPCGTINELGAAGIDRIAEKASRLDGMQPAGHLWTERMLVDQLNQAASLFAKGLTFAYRWLGAAVRPECPIVDCLDYLAMASIQRTEEAKDILANFDMSATGSRLEVARLGACSAYLGDDDVVQRLERSLIAHGGEYLRVYLADFKEAVEKAGAEVRGIPNTYIDSDSHLTRREDGNYAELSTINALPSAESPLFALWNFRCRPVAISGAAKAVWEIATSFQDSVMASAAYRRLFLSGQSRIRLDFEVPEFAPAAALELELEHLAAVRPYVPYCGEAQIEISLDGNPLDHLWILSKDIVSVDRSFAVHRIRIPGFLLAAGSAHHIEISLKDSTTTYWLFKATLKAIGE